MQYHVMRNVFHDGKAFARRDTIELEEGSNAAVALLASGAISETPLAPEPVAPQNRDLVVEKPKQPEVGGTRTETGEPSLDGRDGEGARKEATDVSPKVNEVPLDRMNRAQLDVAARAAGIPDDKIAAAETKKVLIDLIEAKTPEVDEAPGAEVAPGPDGQQPAPATTPETNPEVDPSANL